jgi:hypothetical protein
MIAGCGEANEVVPEITPAGMTFFVRAARAPMEEARVAEVAEAREWPASSRLAPMS